MSSVCLNMIVKNEEAILERCLTSVAPWIDHYVIADTGSTDKTPELIRDFFSDKKIDGELVRLPFIHFEQARNGALEAARKSPKAFDYILLTDADMELVVDDDAFRTRLRRPAHLVRQVAGITYDNVRFVHRALEARYVGVTHEYLDTRGMTGERLDGVWFLDHAEGSSRQIKSERDARLLRAGLRKEPQNARYMFYLAQTYKDLKQFKAAIRWYKRRIAAGGYAEEVWYSAYMIAFCLKELGEHDRFVAQALLAYQMRPTRAEPLYMLANYFREKGDHALATMLCETGIELPFPDDHLFIEPFPYECGFDHELSIVGYYSSRPEVRKRAFDLCMHLSTDGEVPAFVRHTAVQNSVHYAPSGAVAFGESFRVYPLASAGPEGLAPMNPSLAVTGDGEILCNLRWVNYRIGADGRYAFPAIRNDAELDKAGKSGKVCTRNELTRLVLHDDRVEVQTRAWLADAAERERSPRAWILGYEDLRIFAWQGGWWASSTIRDRSPDGLAEIALLELDVSAEAPRSVTAHVQSFRPETHQKNWVPLVRCGDLLFVYEADPTLILRVDPETKIARELNETVPALSLKSLRGSSQAIPFNVDEVSGFLYVAHEAFSVGGGRRRYTHRLVWLDDALTIQHVSDPFYFSHPGIEFCAGLARIDGQLLFALGVEDSSAWLATADVSAALEWLLLPAARRIKLLGPGA